MKKGFTLVELLAVIIILAIILVIAVPQVTGLIEDTKLSSLKSSAMILASSAEKEYSTRQMRGIMDPITCPDITNLSSDYESCEVTFNNGVATVTLEGTGKFAGLKVQGTKHSAEKID